MSRLYTPKQLIEANIFPLSLRTLRVLIENGEKERVGEYHHTNYIHAMNSSNSTTRKGARWLVTEEQVDKWKKRRGFVA